MSTNNLRVTGKRAFPKDTKPILRLIRPSSECSTLVLALNMPREVKEMLRDMNQKRRAVKERDAPDVA